MTDEELQRFVDQRVRLTYGGQSLTGKLIAGFEAQLSVKAPYAIEWGDKDSVLGTYEVRRVAIPSAAAVESIEPLDESEYLGAEIEEDANEQQTPG
jgi:hypothetical protein